MNPTPKGAPAPDASPDARNWLSVADFAAARGCSIRTVKRYIENGEVETRKEGARRFVRTLEPQASPWDEGTQQKGRAPRSVSLLASVHAQSEGQKGHAKGTQSDTGGTQPVSLWPMDASEREKQLGDELARERELNGFLRGLIEGHARAEAELRASLREALRAMPKQLQAHGGTNESAQVEMPVQSPPAPLRTIAHQSDERDGEALEDEDQLLALCRRICQQ